METKAVLSIETASKRYILLGNVKIAYGLRQTQREIVIEKERARESETKLLCCCFNS